MCLSRIGGCDVAVAVASNLKVRLQDFTVRGIERLGVLIQPPPRKLVALTQARLTIAEAAFAAELATAITFYQLSTTARRTQRIAKSVAKEILDLTRSPVVAQSRARKAGTAP